MPLIRKTPEPSDHVASADSARERLKSGGAEARWAAARELAAASDVDTLAAALALESDRRVREAILTSLARIGGVSAARAVAMYIRSDDAALRISALDALQAMGDDCAPLLPALLADPDSDVRLLACELVRTAADDATIRLLSDLLDRDREPNVCAAAVDVLAEIGNPDAAPAMRRCAERFAGVPFLAFAISVALTRLEGAPAQPLA
jgi:HEAT repeat protein